MILCVLLSVYFEFYTEQTEVISFSTDYLVGIACSIVVVIITTYLQFKYEQRRISSSILSDIQFFFFDFLLVVMSFYPDEDESEEVWKYHYEKIYKDTKEISAKLSSIEWFSPIKTKNTNDLQKAIIKIMIYIAKTSNKKEFESINHIVNNNWLSKIKENALLLTNVNEYTAQQIKYDYDEVFKHLENLRLIYTK